MKIYNIYGDEQTINETTMEFAIDKLEGHEWYKKGTVKDLLESGQVCANPFCAYANSKELLENF